MLAFRWCCFDGPIRCSRAVGGGWFRNLCDSKCDYRRNQFFGRKGRIFAVVIGGLIIGTINNGLNILQVQTYYQLVVMGGLIIIAVYWID